MPIYEEEPVVTRRVVEEPVEERRVVERPVVRREVVREAPRSSGLANFALVKYGFIMLMTLIVLFFIAKYLLPLIPR